MQKSFENDTKQIVQVLNQQSHGDESKVIMQINRFSDQLDFKYSQYLSQNPESNNAIISYQPEEQQQSVNYQIKLLCDTNDDQKLQFFRSTLYVWLFWESVMFIILLFNVFQIDKYCNQKIGYIEFGSLLIGLFALVLIKHVNQKKLVCLDVINNNNIDKIFLFMVIVAQGFFHVKLISVIECHYVGNRNYAGEYNYKLEREIIYIGILIHLSILISIGFILVITLIQQKIDPKQYFMISFVISLILGIMYQAAQLKIELIPFLLIVLIFCLFGTLTVLSGQQITNGKFYLNQKQKYMGALLLYLNLFRLCF